LCNKNSDLKVEAVSVGNMLRTATLLAATTVAAVDLPHIIVIMADDAGWNDFGFTRGIEAPASDLVGSQALTPNIDALAKTGIILANHYTYRYCSPSRGSFLTGRLPFHAHEANPGLFSPGCTNLNSTMLPAKLAEAGYISHHVGKVRETCSACTSVRH
jgi:arylsulfatase I/J